ncbi:cytochrome P450 [Asanoa siamensis]|uniref:cytochrome P450 n=1 Tax=Asanoa siamensis TaxID=926357 RepID=UPI001943E5D6|nr:cytochrome P450 [Asanoa siamensis]
MGRVSLYDGTPAWLVTRHEDVRRVLSDSQFSAEGGWRFQSSASRVAAERAETSFTVMDPPQHSYYRRLLIRHFTVKRVERLRPAIQAIVNSAIDEMIAGSRPADLVSQLALPIASRTMCHVLGVPYEDHQWYEERSEVRSLLDADPAEAQRATQDLLDYVDRLIDRKQRSPGEDLTSYLAAELLEPGLVTRAELIAILRLLLTAGHETTGTMIGTGTLVLLLHPEQLAALRRDQALMGPAIEELLRYLSILHSSIVRVAKVDVELGGQRIRAGDGLIAAPAQANKDHRKFPEPDRFDIERDASGHIAFGFGVHQCLGQAIARLEMKVAFEQLLVRLPGLRLACDPADLAYESSNLISVRTLPVTW